ncbi:MAG TPA: porin family protein [Flavisolibacter sp.]|nr:porin family protein [Flavisolibacter sp.]
MYIKKLGLLSLVVIAGMAVYAQDPAMGSSSTTPTLKTPMAVAPRFGIKAGANIATLEPDNYRSGNTYSANSKTSLYAGLFANIPLSGMLRFQPELLYSRQGAKSNTTTIGTGTGGSTVTTNSKFEQDLSYINLPLMFQYQTPGGFMAELGPQIGYAISANKVFDNGGEENNEDSFDSFDLAAGLGLGYMSRVGLGINARYNFGLANIIQEGNTKDGPELKNRVLQIGLSYQFGANK